MAWSSRTSSRGGRGRLQHLMAQRYRILHLVTRLELGGAQQNTLYCATHHDRSRFDVEVIAGRGGFLDSEASRIPDARVQLVDYLEHPISPASDLLAVFKLRDYFRRAEIDLVHTHSSKAGILGRLAAHLAGVPAVVHTVHGWSFNPTQPPMLRGAYLGLERLAAHVTDKLIVVSGLNRQVGLERGIGRAAQYTVLHSGIDLDRYRSAPSEDSGMRRELGFGSEHIVVGTLSSMKPQKAPLDFVRAAAAAHACDERLRFVFAGDGILRDQVEQLIDELGMGPVIRLCGWRRDVTRLLAAMDVFVLTSLFEGLPRAVLQAMAAGVPVVATAVDGTPEVVAHRETGLLVPPSRPDAVAEGILTLLEDEALRSRCVAQAGARLDGAFDIRRMVGDLEDLYLELLHR